MKLVDMTVASYIDLLKSNAPAPGGGSVSALSAAQGIGLVLMVINLTIGKEKYAEYEAHCKEAAEAAEGVLKKLTAGIDEDTEAFNRLSAAYKMPKETDEQKAVRSAAIREANLGATEVPFAMMRVCLDGIRIAGSLVGKSNPGAVSDIGAAVLNLLAGAKGSWLNVKINLPGIKDEEAKARFETGSAIVEEAEALAQSIYNEVLALL